MEDLSCWKEKFELCVYAKKLLDKIEYLNTKTNNPVDIEEVKKGIYYARKYHGSQMRQSGDPYYSHPIEVAIMIAEFTAYKELDFYTNNVIIASLLHDTIEDTELTEEMIVKIFNSRVGIMVSMLSKSEGKTIRDIVNLAFQAKDQEVLLIKLFDRLHNILTLHFKKEERQRKKAIETINIFLTLTIYLGIESAKELIEEICYTIIDPNYKKYGINNNNHLLFLASQGNF